MPKVKVHAIVIGKEDNINQMLDAINKRASDEGRSKLQSDPACMKAYNDLKEEVDSVLAELDTIRSLVSKFEATAVVRISTKMAELHHQLRDIQ